jgi:phosphoenolpyruvate-protein kinase (PTS system EI component)
MIGIVAEAGRKRKIEVSVCGGLASDFEGVAALIGLGISKLSVDVPVVAKIKALVRRLSSQKCHELVAEALRMSDANEVRRSFKNLLNEMRGEKQ